MEKDVPAQVEKLIQQATAVENLCQCYVGWCPFVRSNMYFSMSNRPCLVVICILFPFCNSINKEASMCGSGVST
jgi:hypothetical protein